MNVLQRFNIFVHVLLGWLRSKEVQNRVIWTMYDKAVGEKEASEPVVGMAVAVIGF